MLAKAIAVGRWMGTKASGPAAAAVQRRGRDAWPHTGAGVGPRVAPAPLAVSAAPLAQLTAACAGARRAWAPSLGQRRAMSYFSGSHFDGEHMRDAKNPHLPEVSNPDKDVLTPKRGCAPNRGLTWETFSEGRWRGRCGGQDLWHGAC